jgi:FMN phosphatase YigB (HAD superfamily)
MSDSNLAEALLLDLDGTLLDLDIGKFVPAYTEALSQKFTGLANKDEFVRHLFGSLLIMVENRDPEKKNRDIFYDEFCRRLGLTYHQIKPIIDDFYSNDFPALSCWGRIHPHARPVVDAARAKGLILVLATNPIFPETAVMQRLSWSGLRKDDFQLITTMDNMHFCKPNPEYFLEISKKIDIAPEYCLMAGNDTLEDLSASKAGMKTFLVEDFILERENVEPAFDYRGSLEDLFFLLNTED